MGYTTLEKVRVELRSEKGFSSNTIPSAQSVQNWINEESARVDFDAKRKFGLTEYTDYASFDGQARITLQNAPVVNIVSVHYNTMPLGEPETWVELTPHVHYKLHPETGVLLLILTKFSPRRSDRNIRIVYNAGYETPPEVIEMLTTKMVAKRVLDTIMNQKTSTGKTERSQVRIGGVMIVEPTEFGVNAYKELKEDIADLKKELVGGFGVHRYVDF